LTGSAEKSTSLAGYRVFATHPLFAQHDFFDARDTLQVKYEMLRRIQIDGQPINRTATAFGCSRPSFYQAQAAFKAQGLAGLLPRKRGPHQAHKLTEEILAFVETMRTSQTPPSTPKLVQQIHQQFNLVVHRRSLERALARRKKNSNDPTAVPHPPVGAAADLVANYEVLRAQVLGAPAGGPSGWGWAPLVRQGLAAWLGTVPAAEVLGLPRLNATPAVALPGLQQQVANLLVTMVWNHYQNSAL
jgi:transposase